MNRMKSLRKISLKYMEEIMFFVLIFLLGFQFFVGTFVKANAGWYDSAWQYRMKITVDNTQVAGTLNDFPILISSTVEEWKDDLNGGNVQQIDGGDILFTLDDGTTKLSHEIESYDRTTGELIAWVEMPTLSGSVDTELYVYYGNDAAPNQWETDGSTWSEYMAVHHFEEDCSTTGCYDDSANTSATTTFDMTPRRLDATTPDFNNVGKIGDGVLLDGDEEYVEMADNSSIDFQSSAFTAEFWVRNDESLHYSGLLDKGAYSLKVNPEDELEFGIRQDNVGDTFFSEYSVSTNYAITSLAYFDDYLYAAVSPVSTSNGGLARSLDGDSWSEDYVQSSVATIDNLIVYADRLYMTEGSNLRESTTGTSFTTVGTLACTPSATTVFNSALYIGCSDTGEIYRYFKGSLSEVYDFSPSLGDNISSMTVYDGEMYIGFEDTGRTYRSDNGTTWTSVFFNSNYANLYSLSWFDDKLLFGYYYLPTTDSEILVRSDAGGFSFDSFVASALTTIDAIMSYSGRVSVSGNGARFITRPFNTQGSWNDNVGSSVNGVSIVEFKGGVYVGGSNRVYKRNNPGIDVHSSTDLSTVTFTHITVSYDDSTGLRIYKNGQLDAFQSGTLSLLNSDWDLMLGRTTGESIGGSNNMGEEFLDGKIDEFRLANDTFSDDWIETNYNTQNSPQTFYSIGPEETEPVDPETICSTWYDSEWEYQRIVTIDSAQVVENVANFPVLIQEVEVSDFRSIESGGLVAQNDGGDILFTAEDGVTKIPHEIEYYDPVQGILYAWVEVPSVSSTADTNFCMYFGNSSADDQWDITGEVWSAYDYVYHMIDDIGNCVHNSAVATTASCLQSFIRGESTDTGVSQTIFNDFGKIADGLTFDDGYSFGKINDNGNGFPEYSDDFTIEAWVKPEEMSKMAAIFDKGSYGLKITPEDKLLFSGRNDQSITSWANVTVPSGSGTNIYRSMAVFDGYIYLAIDWNGPSAPSYDGVFRSADGVTWSQAGKVWSPPAGDLNNLIVYDGRLYVTLDDAVYYTEDGTNFTLLGTTGSSVSGFASSTVYNGQLFFGSEDNGRIYRVDSSGGTPNFAFVQNFGGATDRISGLVEFEDNLYAALEGDGDVYESSNGTVYSIIYTQPTGEEDITTLSVMVENLIAGFFDSSPSGSDIYWIFSTIPWANQIWTETGEVRAIASFGDRIYASGDQNILYKENDTNSIVNDSWTLSSALNSSEVIGFTQFNGQMFAVTSGGILRYSGGGFDYESTATLTEDQYSHVVISYDKDLGSNNFNMYVDGVLDGSMTISETLDSDNDHNLQLGRSIGSVSGGHNNWGDELLVGEIDEFRIFNGVLSSGWVQTNYNSQNDPGTFYSMSASLQEEQGGGPGGNTGMVSVTRTSISGSIGPGMLTLTGGGDLVSGINFAVDSVQGYDQSATWTASDGIDILSYRDTTDLDGFRVQLALSSAGTGFEYSGSNQTQEAIPFENMRVFAEYSATSDQYGPPTRAVNDLTKTISINSDESCDDADLINRYNFNESFSAGDYGMTLSSVAKTYLTSSAGCIAEGEVKIKRMVFNIPAASAAGDYESVLMILVVDGQ